jgi:hypothetical protein
MAFRYRKLEAKTAGARTAMTIRDCLAKPPIADCSLPVQTAP